jgi:uncharacterized lipoprotein YehR (DUF1307 family)
MKKIFAIVIALMLVVSLAACGGGGGGGTPSGDGGGGSAGGGGTAVGDVSCPCDPECTNKECEGGDKCKCGDLGNGSYTFKVEINTDVAGWQPIYKTFGEAVVVLDQLNASDKHYGIAEGNGEYLEFFVDGFDYGQEETTYNFTVQLSGFDPRVGGSITVGINCFSAEVVTSFSTGEAADGMKMQTPDMGFIMLNMLGQEILDPETELYLFEVPLEDGNGYKTFNLDQVSAEFEGHIEMSITVTLIP